MNARIALILPVALLYACGRDPDPTSVTITSGNQGGAQIAAEPGKESRVKIDTEGFKADVRVPGLGMLMNKAEIDGVKMYPGTRIGGVNIAGGEGKDDGKFAMRFDAPADRGKVAAWFSQEFAHNDFEARQTPTGFAGTKKDGDWFTLDLSDAAGGHTQGEFKLGERQR